MVLRLTTQYSLQKKSCRKGGKHNYEHLNARDSEILMCRKKLMDVNSVDCEIRKAIILLYMFILCISKTVYVCVSIPFLTSLSHTKITQKDFVSHGYLIVQYIYTVFQITDEVLYSIVLRTFGNSFTRLWVNYTLISSLDVDIWKNKKFWHNRRAYLGYWLYLYLVILEYRLSGTMRTVLAVHTLACVLARARLAHQVPERPLTG